MKTQWSVTATKNGTQTTTYSDTAADAALVVARLVARGWTVTSFEEVKTPWVK